MLLETYIEDPLAATLLNYAERLPEAQRLLVALAEDAPGRSSAGARTPKRIGVRGLTGSARAFLASWLHRSLGGTFLLIAPHGDPFEELRDDLEYFRGPGAVLAFP